MEIDAYVGEFMEVFEEPDLLENTLVFFTSDNGPQTDSWLDSGFAPLRGARGTGWEGAIRVPGIAATPGWRRWLRRPGPHAATFKKYPPKEVGLSQ